MSPAIQGIPQSWYQDKTKIQERQQEQAGKDFGGLAKARAEQAIGMAADKEIKKPSMFLKSLKNIISTLGGIRQGGPLMDKLNVFFNDFFAQARKGTVVVPGVIQKALLQDAASFDKTGDIINQLKSAFDERYGDVFEKEQQIKQYKMTGQRPYAVAAMLRKLAAELMGKALSGAAKRYIEGLIESNNLSKEQLGAYKLIPKGNSSFEGVLPEDPVPGIRLQYDGDIKQDDLLGILDGKQFTHEGHEIEIIPEKMPDGASWGYTGKN